MVEVLSYFHIEMLTFYFIPSYMIEYSVEQKSYTMTKYMVWGSLVYTIYMNFF